MYAVTFKGFSNESSHKGLHGNYKGITSHIGQSDVSRCNVNWSDAQINLLSANSPRCC